MITIQDQPSTTYIQPAFAPIEYLLSSTNTAESGFRIVCKIYFNPAGANTLVSTQQISTRPSSTQSILSIQNIVKSFVKSQYSLLNGDNIDIATTALTYFRVVFQEYYDNALQGSTVTSDTIPVYNASPTYIEFATNKYYNYQLASFITDTRLLSSFDNTKDAFFGFSSNDRFMKVKPTQKIQIQWLQKEEINEIQVWLITLDANFATIQLSKLTSQIFSVQGYYSLDIGRQEVPNHAWDVAPNFTNCKYYGIVLYDELTADLASKVYLYELNDCDTNYTEYELHYLNSKGGFDSFVFDGKSRKETNISKTLAKYSSDRVSGTSLNYSTSAQRTRPFDTSLSEVYNINSRLLTDFEMDGLKDLATSPEVYWRNENGFVSVNIEAQTYERKKSEDGKVFSLALQMTVDNSDKRQW